VRAVVIVEGLSDQVALETLAERHGRDLEAEGVRVLPIGGAQAIRRVLEQFAGTELTISGLCDEAEAPSFARGFERAGIDAVYHVCVADLEDELIRALGVDAVQAVVEAHGDLRSFRTLQKQPVQRSWTTEAQLRRFFGSGARRKIRYARYLVEALDLADVPRPLDAVLADV